MKTAHIHIALFILLLSSCRSSLPVNNNTEIKQYWPPLPAQPRFVHEATIHNNLDIEKEDERNQVVRLLAGEKRNVHKLMKPYAIAVSKGRLYVSDTAIKQIHVFDIPRRRYFRLGFRLEGQLSSPRGLALDDKEQLYVVDSEKRQIFIYDKYGLFLKSILLSDDVIFPTGIDVSSNGERICVVDTGGIGSQNHKIMCYNNEGKKLFQFGTRGFLDGEFNLPVDISISDNGSIYVLDAGNFRVQVFDKNGLFLTKWGKVGNGFGHFGRPRAIAQDSQGNIYVSDATFANIQIFNPQGQLLMPLGARSFKNKDGYFSLIAGISIDETNRLYVVDQKFKKLEIFRRLTDAEGKALTNH